MSHAAPAIHTVDFAPPSIGADEIAEVVATLKSGWLSTGPRVERFERAFADYVGASHAVAVNSCTAALHLALLVSGIGADDEVVTTPLTFCATANAVIHVGATPRFADVDPATGNLDPAAAAAAMTPHTRALMPVHYAGRPVNVAAFRSLADAHGVILIDDAAHCIEGWSDQGRIGSTADLTCFSFYATKNLTTGEGGMLTTDRAGWATEARVASLHGMSRNGWARYSRTGTPDYDVVMPGFKYNMPDILAAIGLHQLAGLEERLRRREAIWRHYDEAFADLPLTLPAPVAAGDRHARHLYTVLIEPHTRLRRDDVAARLREQGVSTSVHFRALHLHTYYADRFGFRRGMFPGAERVSDCTLSLPFSAAMSEADVDAVVGAVRHTILRNRPGHA